MISMMMGRTLLTISMVAPIAIGSASRDAPLTLQTGSRVWVNGTSNVKNFECKAVNPTVTVATTEPNAVGAVTAGEKAVGAVHLEVAVATMDCGSSTMNGHMKDAMKVKDHPDIDFTLVSYALVKSADSVGVTLAGTLTIDGTSKSVTIKAGAKNAGGGRAPCHRRLRRAEHEGLRIVKPPTLFLGTMRVGEKVQVHFDLLLKS